jgi:hypothetical protein
MALSNDLRILLSLPACDVRAHPAAADFPGGVPADAKPVTRALTLKPRQPRWHSTGLYAPPGQLIEVTVPAAAAGQGFKVRIGCHRDRLWRSDTWTRVPDITRAFAITNTLTQAANAFGGPLYIEVPEGCPPEPLEITVSGGIPAPHFKLGETTLEAWRNEIRHYPVPWAEIEGRYLTLSLPSENIRQLDDPDAVCRFWDGVQEANARLASLPAPQLDRFVLDRQISAGYMHSGYPIMAHLDQRHTVANPAALAKGSWGFFHELGHNHQRGDWTFAGTGEVTCNLFSMHTFETVCHLPMTSHAAMKDSARERRMRKFFGGNGTFEDWKQDPFLALTLYHQLAAGFGWEVFYKVFAQYRSLPAAERPRTDDAKRDQFLVRMSQATGRNLGPLFDAWTIPISATARNAVTNLPSWLPEPDFPQRYRNPPETAAQPPKQD